MNRYTGHPRAAALALALVATAAAAPSAAAAPAPGGVSVTPGGASTAASRTLAWAPVAPDSGGTAVVYEGGVTTTAAPPAAPAGFGGAASVGLTVPEGQIWFHVRSVETVGGMPIVYSAFTTVGPFVSDRTAPTVTPVVTPALNPRAWTRAATTVSFACVDANPGPGPWCPAPVALGEGAGQVVTRTATDALGQSGSGSVTVSVDLTPPVAATPATPAADATVTSTRPGFSWTPATDPLSGIQYYEVYVVGRGKVGSSTYRSNHLVSTATLSPGPLEWFVRTFDNANNRVDSGRFALTIDPDAATQPPDPPAGPAPGPAGRPVPPAPAPAPASVVSPPRAGSSVVRPTAFNAKALRPRAGVRLRQLRPVLRWKRGPKTTRLYNVQVFEVRGRKIRKVVSAFPRSTRYRLPAGTLRRDRRYVWRVWPYVKGRGYTAKPVGVSYFDIRPRVVRKSNATPPAA